ncbi:MAG: DUF6056 family protein [Treponema sp.]|nr:DUF6056 family protein [Treponema sp.]
MFENIKKLLYKKFFIIYSLWIILCFFLFLIINRITPLIGEDYTLTAYNYFTGPENILSFFKDVFNRIIIQSQGWNVRLGEQLSILFGSMNPVVFDISNAIVSVLFIHLIYMYAFPSKTTDYGKAAICGILSFALILLFQPVIGEVFFWRTGSTNFLWGVTILLIFTLPIYYVFCGIDILSGRKITIILHTLTGFFAGFTNENTVISTIALYAVTIIFVCFIKRERIKFWMVTSFGTLFLGFLYMLFAPSTAHRVSFYREILGITSNFNIETILSRIPIIWIGLIKNYLVYFLLLFVLFIAFLVFQAIGKTTREKTGLTINYSMPYCFIRNTVLLLISSLSVTAMAASPYYVPRAFFGFSFFMLVTIIYCFYHLINRNKKLFKIAVIITSLILIPAAFEYSRIYSTHSHYNDFVKKRAEYLTSTADGGQTSAEYVRYDNKHDARILMHEWWIYDGDRFDNRFSGYYGLDCIFIKIDNTQE